MSVFFSIQGDIAIIGTLIPNLLKLKPSAFFLPSGLGTLS